MRLVVTAAGRFSAQVTRALLPHTLLLCAEETLPRVTHVSLPADRLCLSFPMNPDPLPVWRGEAIRSGDIMFHGCGEALHQWTRGPSRWGLISLDPAFLAGYARALAGVDLDPPAMGQVLRPRAADHKRLLRLHAQAIRLGQTRPAIVGQPEVARVFEQELIEVLIDCLTRAQWRPVSPDTRRQARIMERFEKALADRPGRNIDLTALRKILCVSERTLQSCCRRFLGIGPARYLRLRRLAVLRSALLNPRPVTASVAELAGRLGFTKPGRLGAAYRMVFGETPSMTLQRARTAWR